ncbi:LTA synthase family protein [Microbulbifer sp. SA54]|uniref:LTA synthase family protein n=1 Tax=Microbulbifer sp. SA54 TaxID=3401577 RepID=UPI003AAF4963
MRKWIIMREKTLFYPNPDNIWVGSLASLSIAIFAWGTYTFTSKVWAPRLWYGLESFYSSIVPESIIVILITLSLYCSTIKRQALRILSPTIVIISLYILIDATFFFLGRLPRISDISSFSGLLESAPHLAITGSLLTAGTLVLSSVLLSKNIKGDRHAGSTQKNIFRVLAACTILLTLNPSIISPYIIKRHSSEAKTVQLNGRISSFLYYKSTEDQYQKLFEEISGDAQSWPETQLFPGEIHSLRNIHYIVLESFIDPRLIKGTQFKTSPLAPALSDLLDGATFSRTLSPVYGGGTAQAEFELLVGLPALAQIGSIDFNVLGGKPMKSFVSSLNEQGYEAFATIATSSIYFNSRNAYKSIGFGSVDFLEETKSFRKNPNDVQIFDGDLLRYNLSKVSHRLESHAKPFINYVLGMYGHIPFRRNLKDRPDRIEVNTNIEAIKKISNQFYYRTDALANYIRELQRLDPESIIYITSDHLPALPTGSSIYSLDERMNISLLFENSKLQDLEPIEFYKIPWNIWARLTKKPIMDEPKKSSLEKEYIKQLAKSRGI